MFKKKNNINNELYGIIGLGRFGFALAQNLVKAGKEVIVLDKNADIIKEASTFTENAFIVPNLTQQTLEEVGIQNCDTVVVCIGDKIDVSVLTTMHLINMGIPNVISKANSADQGKVLEKLGAKVVFPETDMAIRLANRLISSQIMEYISLNDEIDITELRLPEQIQNLSIKDMDIRKNYNLNIIAVKKGDNISTEITPDLILNGDDVIVVIGKNLNIKKFENSLNS